MQNQHRIYTQSKLDSSGSVIIGNDRAKIEAAFDAAPIETPSPDDILINTDGGTPYERRRSDSHNGDDPTHWDGHTDILSAEEITSVLDDGNVNKAALAFREANRDGFFTSLRACREHGTDAVVPADLSQQVLVDETYDEWVTADLEPLPAWQRKLKRAFDIAFALLGLIALAPLIVLIAIAIKIDSRGPVLYTQQRSGLFGEPFQCCKFRTMYPESEDAAPEDDKENDRITRVGHVLRKTNLDEIPQLWLILQGTMSTVGPRAAWVEEEEAVLEHEVDEWRKRWFVKPGLTGLAQINGVNSTDGEAKLRYDLEYVQRQSFLLDLWIVTVQISIAASNIIKPSPAISAN